MISTTKYFTSNWYYLIPTILIIYSIGISIFSNTIENIQKFKRIYYSLCTLGYIIMLKKVNLIGLVGSAGLFGTSRKAWSIIIFTIAVFISAMVIDNWIVSGYVFKEFGLFGAKFVKDEVKEASVTQGDYIVSLEKGIKSSFTTIDEIKALFNNNSTIESITNNSFDFIENFRNILKKFYKNRVLSAGVDVLHYTYNYKEIVNVVRDLLNEYNLTLKEKLIAIYKLKTMKTYYIKKIPILYY